MKLRRTDDEFLTDCFDGQDCDNCEQSERQHTVIRSRFGSRYVRCPETTENTGRAS